MSSSSERGVRKVRDIARELAESESSEPPAGLLEKIKAEIPQEVRVGTAVPGPVSRSFVPRQGWLIAASLLVGVGAGVVGLRTFQLREGKNLRVEAHLAAPQSAAAKAPAPPPPAVPPPPSLKAGEAPRRAPAARMAEEPKVAEVAPAPAPKPEALERRDAASLDQLSDEKQRVQQPAQPVQAPENLPAPSAARAASPPAPKEAEGRVEGVVGQAAGGAPPGVENQAPRQKAVATEPLLSSQLQPLKKEKDQKTRKVYDAARFEESGTGAFVDAATHPLSTFGLDVDTASYAAARRALEEGRLPDPASVRVEEWLSWFDYGDPAPARGDFAIRAEGAPSPFAHGPSFRLVRFNLKARQARAESGRPAVPVAQNAVVQVEFNSVVVARYRLLGYESRAIPDDRFRDEAVAAGQVGAGHGVTVLYEIELRKGAPHWEQPVATIRLHYRAPGTGTPAETFRRLGFQDFVPAWEQASPALRLATLVAELAEILEGSPWAKPATLSDVARRIREVAAQFPGNEKVAELADLAARAARIKARQVGPEE
ncbi:MAG TPA: von Willebrand factor type A domain-containing protein [Thermoanaerobaculia bacterium]|nr:von Willebrand factor type A domain-containing protein [Thermoanaerobaculia bacterium]